MFNPKKQLKMKKVFLMATLFAAVTFTSCGGKKEGEGENSDTTAVAEDTTASEPAVEEPAMDTTAADTASAE
jgi:hypothetical protein